MSAAGALVALLVTATGADVASLPFDPARHLDVELAAFTATPERFVLCLAAHPLKQVEVDVCGGGAAGLLGFSAHGYWRKRWVFSQSAQRSFVLALGPGVGAHVLRRCPFATCAVSAGPEAVLSVEAVQWLGARLGLTAQLDGGLAVMWAEAAPGLLELVVRFPVRGLLGVTF